MTRPEDLTNKIASLKQENWVPLFELAPRIKTARKFGRLMGAERMNDGSITLPYWREEEIVSQFFNTVYSLGLVMVFDWSTWTEGLELLNSAEADFEQCDIETLCKLLTVIIRSDKFCEGYLINCFETGVIGRILDALYKRVSNMEIKRSNMQIV